VGGVFAIAESRGLARVSEGDLVNSLDVHVHHIVAHHAESESRRPVREGELVDHNRGLPGSEDELMASAGNLGIDRAGFARAPLRRRAPPRPPVHDEKGAGRQRKPDLIRGLYADAPGFGIFGRPAPQMNRGIATD
jgi:hypothetical protein